MTTQNEKASGEPTSVTIALSMFPSIAEQISAKSKSTSRLFLSIMDEFEAHDFGQTPFRPLVMPSPDASKSIHLSLQEPDSTRLSELAASYGVAIKNMAYSLLMWWLRRQGDLPPTPMSVQVVRVSLDPLHATFIKTLVAMKYFESPQAFAQESLDMWQVRRAQHDVALMGPFDYWARPNKAEDAVEINFAILKSYHYTVVRYSGEDGVKQRDVVYNAVVMLVEQWIKKVQPIWQTLVEAHGSSTS